MSLVQVIPKKGGMTIVLNEKNELNPMRTVTRLIVCIDYKKLNDAIQKDYFLLPFINQMLKSLFRQMYYYFFDGLLGYFQILIALED